MQRDDEQLVFDYLNGDDNALNILINRYLKHIYNFVYRFSRNIQDTEDISQETFFKVWKNLDKFKQGGKFKTWLFTIARNTAFDLLRKKRNFVFSDFENSDGDNFFEENIPDPEPLQDELVSKIEEKKILDDALYKISPLYREVLILHYHEQFTFDEIGKILNKPLNTVKSQHRRGIVELKILLT